MSYLIKLLLLPDKSQTTLIVPAKQTEGLCLGLQVSGFRSYVDLYVKDKLDETGVALKVVNEVVNDRWEVCLTMSERGFQQISFVNSIATTKVNKPALLALRSESSL